jgi:TRAP-type transport system small permease protein
MGNKKNARIQLADETKGKSIGYRIINAISVGFLTVMILDVSVIVVGRFIFRWTPGWGEPIALICVIWFSLLSAANALADNGHLRVSYFLDRFPKELRLLINFLFYAVFFCIALFLIYQGTWITWQTRRSMIPGLNISQSFRYAALPVGGVFMLLAVLKKAWHKELI